MSFMRNIVMKEKAIIGKKVVTYDSDEHLVYRCLFNPKDPHNNVIYMTEQFWKIKYPSNSIELYYDSDSDSDCNKVEIKEINFIETINNIQELNLCEIDNFRQ